MKTIVLLLSSLAIALAASCQTSSIISIAPGTEINVPSSAHWQYIMPKQTLLAVAQNLNRAKGCIADYHTLQATVTELQQKINLLETALSYVDTAQAVSAQVEQVQEALKLRQKIRQWFHDRWKDLTAIILGLLAATEAAYIVYQTLQP
jgi:hypothetical protein